MMNSAAEKRGQRRVRRVSATAAASAFAGVVQFAVGLLVVPLSLGYLGNERYGLWMTVTSLTAMVAFADFGMGNGLLNAVASADGRDNPDEARSAVSSAFFMLAGLALILGTLFWLSYPLVPWEAVVNAPPSLGVEARLAVAATLLCAIVSLPLGTTQRVQMGYQEGFINGAWQAGGTLLGLLALVVAISNRASLPVLVLCLAAAPVVALAANAVALFVYRRPALRPRRSHVSRATMARLLGAGSLFFAIQLAGAVGYQLPTLAIARIMEPAAVTAFAVPLRLFMAVPAMLGLFLAPLWPAYREALTRGDVPWVRHLVVRSVTICVALTAAWAATLVFFGPTLLRWWVGDRVVAPIGLRLGLAAWSAMTGIAGPFAMFMNAAGALRFQAACAWLMAAASVTLCVLLIPVLGVTGAALAMVTAQACCVLVPAAVYVPRLLDGISREQVHA